MKGKRHNSVGWAFICVGALALSACYRQEMANQPRYDPLEASNFFADGMSARQAPAGTVAGDTSFESTEFLTGKAGADFIEGLPLPIDMGLMRRGRERYNIFCAPCHDRTGSGQGMAVLRGFRRLPPSFHLDRLREAPDGYFYDVITHGFASMQDYSAQIVPRDRWAIVAYVRALQFSQNAGMLDVPPDQRQRSGEWKDEP